MKALHFHREAGRARAGLGMGQLCCPPAGWVRCEGENLRQAAGRESRQALRQALRAEE